MNPPPIGTPGVARQQNSGLAVASLILGICGIVLCFGPVAGIPAVICGHKAQSDIKRSGGTMGGGGMAVAGLVMGYISILMIFVMGMLAAIAIPNFVKARQAAQRNQCFNNLKSIEGAKNAWQIENKKSTDAVPTDDDLFGTSRYLTTKPDCPAGGTYNLNAVSELPSCSIHGTAR